VAQTRNITFLRKSGKDVSVVIQSYIYILMMNTNNFVSNECHNSVFRELISNQILTSHKEWLLLTFKATGVFVDPNGVYRQVVNMNNLSRYAKGIDWTIDSLKRRFHVNDIKFIPFLGGDADNIKKDRTNIHVHAYLEVPKDGIKQKVKDVLIKSWPRFIKRSYRLDLNTECWIDDVCKDLVKTNIWYNQRYEGESFQYGTEKLFTSCSSCSL